MNTQELLFSKSPQLAHSLIEHMLINLEKQHVQLLISNTSQVILEGDSTGCSGFFNSEPLQFAVAIDKPFTDWFKVFMHEYSHFEQWYENPEHFNQLGNDIGVLFSWLEGEIELDEKELEQCTQSAIWIEYDCEKRVLNKICTEHLEHLIDPLEYAQLANAYFNFYYYVAEVKKWYKSGQEPYTLESVWKLFPQQLVLLNQLDNTLREAYSHCV